MRSILSKFYSLFAGKYLRLVHSKMSRYYGSKRDPYYNSAKYVSQKAIYEFVNEILLNPDTGKVKGELTEERPCPNCGCMAKESLAIYAQPRHLGQFYLFFHR